MSARKYILSNSIWLTTVGFTQLFEDIEVRNYAERYDSSSYNKRIKVATTLDMKERIQHKLLAGGHKALEQADTRLPRISINIANIEPDTGRYAGKNTKRMLSKQVDDGTGSRSVSYDVQPFPIKIEYSVSIWAKYFEHYAQILENIIPWFDPYVTVGVKERNFGIERELKVSLTGVGQNSTFEMNGPQARIIRGDLSFSVETYAYKALTEESSEMIEKIGIYVIDVTSPMSSETISISASEGDYLS